MITHGPLPVIHADERQLSQLFQELIVNAIRFQGDNPPQIHVAAARTIDEWLISVRDNGIGFDSQYGERIFELFYRVPAAAGYPGTGLGLAICKAIVEKHHGRIWVTSEQGEGSTFHITFPVQA